MAFNKTHDKQAESVRKTTSNVRQLPSSHQNQILSALDTLGAKLVRSETERETMRRLLNEALDAQERLENQLERSHIDIQRRMDQLDEGGNLSEETQTLLDGHEKALNENKEAIGDYNDRQIRLEDKLRDSQQTIAKLQRRIDTQEQKRAKLQRRIERVENIAADAQNALEAKALVLLTDQSHATQTLPHINASAPMQTLEDLHQGNDNDPAGILPTQAWWQNKYVACLALFFALGLGWIMAAMIQSSNTNFVMMPDGTFAPIKKTEIEYKPVEAFNPTLVNDDISLLSTDWLTNDILETALTDEIILDLKAEETPELAVETPEITMDRDLSLPKDIKNIEDKAFNNIAEAQHDLAALYTMGQADVTQNYERAAYWFTQAAAQGIANAAYNLGVLYHQGLGTAQDIDRALDWYRRASQLGHPEAQYNLGIAYIEGMGTRYNPNMAAAFFQQAAMGGIAEAAYNLGLILENGLLGEVRPDDALRWYRGAAEKGSVEAEKALAALAEKLNVTESDVGYLESGETVASYMNAEGEESTELAEEISLGSLVPSRQQIMIAQIQEQLRKMRYYNGPQDGIVGSGTVKAIKSYQIREGLTANGQATENLLSHMLSSGTGF